MFACVGKHIDDQRLILRFWLGRHFGLDMLGCFTEVSATPNQSMDAKESLGAARPNLPPSQSECTVPVWLISVRRHNGH